MDNPYKKRVKVFTPDVVAKLAAQNQESRIKRYPEIVRYGFEQADVTISNATPKLVA